MKVLLTLLVKEFRQLRRDTYTSVMCVLFPIFVMLVMPLVMTMDVRNVRVAVVDLDGQNFSRRLMERIDASDNLELSAVCRSYDEALRMIEADDADVIVEIPYRYERDKGRLSLSANAINGTKGQLGIQYMMQVINDCMVTEAAPRVVPQPSVRYLHNETLNYHHFMIPALAVMLMILLCGDLPALNLVSEKEHGTIEQINVTPVHPFVFTLAKLIPCWLVGLYVLTVAVITARLVYTFPVSGSLATLYLATILFALLMTSLGVMVANKNQTMQQTMFVMLFIIMLFVFMSGLMTPVQSMPNWAQAITYFIPSRYIIDIMRAVWIRGARLTDLWFEFVMLFVFTLLFITAAVVTFKKQQA